MLALVGLYQFFPVLLLTLPAGHAADTWRRSRIVLVCLVAQGLMPAVMAFAAHCNGLTRQALLIASLLLGAARIPDAGAAGARARHGSPWRVALWRPFPPARKPA